MHVVADACIVPVGTGTASVSSDVAEAIRELKKAPGLVLCTHSYGTNIEGEWDDVLNAIRAAHERLHSNGVPRVSTTIKVGTRIDKFGAGIAYKVARVEELLAEDE